MKTQKEELTEKQNAESSSPVEENKKQEQPKQFKDNRKDTKRVQSLIDASNVSQLMSNDVAQLQQTKVCLKSASGTYKLPDDETTHNFSFKESAKGSDVLETTKSHPKGKVDYTDKIIKLLQKDGTIPKKATNITLSAIDTYGIKK